MFGPSLPFITIITIVILLFSYDLVSTFHSKHLCSINIIVIIFKLKKCLIHQQIMNIHCEPGTVLGAEDTAMNTVKSLSLWVSYFSNSFYVFNLYFKCLLI